MRYFNQKGWLSLLLVLFWLTMLPVNTLAGSKEDYVQYYIKYYNGRADANNELVRRVSQVFEKVRLVADKRAHLPPKFVPIKGFDSTDDPLAFALPDGSVVLFQKAIDIIYQDVSPELGDTRAAFVLGHELAHLAKDDFWHREFLSLAKNSPELTGMLTSYRDSNGIKKETEADDRGFIYAAMAGYPVDKLVVPGSLQPDFFVDWEEQTFRTARETHPSSTERADALRVRLQNLLNKLPYFQFGVRLAHFERCKDGVYFFQAFLKHFPAREVFNNLGLCELQLAQQALGEAAYWLPSVLDVTTQLADFSPPYASKGEKEAIAKEHLKKANESFQVALQMEPSYVPTNVNLAITTLYQGEIYQARAAIEKALKYAPHDLEIQGLHAVILYEEGEKSPYVDMWPYAIEQLEKLAQQPKAPLSVLYNAARLLEKRKRTGADKFWQQLAGQAAKLPLRIRKVVCQKAACPAPPRKQSAPKATWQLPVALGATTDNQTLNQWPQTGLDVLWELYEQFFQHPDGSAEVFGLKEQVEMVVLKKLAHVTVKDLPAYCGQPLRERRVVNGTLLSCEEWAALLVDEKIKEVWIVQKRQ